MLGGKVVEAVVHCCGDRSGTRVAMGDRFPLTNVGENGVDEGGGDGEVARVEVLPSEARYPHASDGVVVLRKVVVIARKEEANYFGAYFGPVRVVWEGAPQAVMDEVNHRQRHARGERNVGEGGGVASQTALQLRRWRRL